MRFNRQLFEALTIPCEANGQRFRMLSEPAVVMASALSQSLTTFGEADERDEQDIGGNCVGVRQGLLNAESALVKVALAIWISMMGKMHHCIRPMEAGQCNGMATFLKEPRVCGGRCLVCHGVIQTDSRFIADHLEERCRGMTKHEPAHRIGQSGDMFAAKLTKLFAECGFVQRCRTYSFDWPE